MSDTPDIPDAEWSEEDIVDGELLDGTEADLTPAPIETPTRPTGEPAAKKTVYRGSGFRWSFVFGAILVVLMLILMFQNFQTVDFKFFQWSITAPLAVLILATALVAVIIDELAGFVWRVRRRRELKARAELKELRREVAPPKQSRFRKNK